MPFQFLIKTHVNRKWLILIILFSFPHFLYSQSLQDEKFIDKWEALTKQLSDKPTTQIQRIENSLTYDNLSEFQRNFLKIKKLYALSIADIEKAENETKEFEKKINHVKNPYLKSLFYDSKGNLYFALGECDSTKKAFQLSEFHSNHFHGKTTRIKQLKKLVTIGKINVQFCYGEIGKVIDLLKKNHALLSDKKDPDTYLYYLNSSGNVHFQIGNLTESIRYFEEAYRFSKDEIDNKLYAASALNSLAVIHYYSNNHPKAVEYLDKAYLIYKGAPVDGSHLAFIVNMSTLLIQVDEKKRALQMTLDYRVKAKKIGHFEYVSNLDRIIAGIYLESQLFEKALPFIEEAKIYSRKSGVKTEIIEVLDLLSNYYFEIGNFEEAASVLKQKFSVSDSLNSEKKMSELQKNLLAFESEKKEAKISLLNKENERKKTQLIAIISVATLTLILVLVFWKYQQKMNRIKREMEATKLARAQINPHFLNNAFTSIQAAALKENGVDDVINLTSGVARFTRLMLESSLKENWTLKEECDMLEQYALIFTQKFQNQFNFKFLNSLPFNLLNSIYIPTAILQPLIENAFQFAESSQTIPSVDVKITEENKTILIQIANSIGNEVNNRPLKINPNETSHGLEIIDQRILYFNRKSNIKISRSFEINDSIAKTQILIEHENTYS